jgi:WD40 repeat protein
MSAQHVYHTALPLSPETSILRSRFFGIHPSLAEDWTTQQTSSSSLPATWGVILRTIKADSGKFTYVAVVGQRIAAVCEDNTVNLYDAVTGVIRLSLDAPRRVTKVEGSPDGSILFCAHRRAREITLWDTQTGGLIHTFTTKFEIGDIAVSLAGKYLATCSSDGTFRFWEVENRCGGSRFLGEPVICICWLEPEDQVALALKGTVVVLEMTTGRTLHTFPVGGSVRGVAFSAGKRRLAVWLASGIESTIVVIDISLGLTLVSSHPLAHLSSFTFSGDGDQVVCAVEAGNLRFFYITISTPNWHDCPSHLGTVNSIGLLPSGHLVVNVGDSIRLLATNYAQPYGTSPDLEISCVHPLDNGRAICALSRDHEDANLSLLDMETMKTLANYRIGTGGMDPSFTLPIVCASIDHGIVVLCFPEFDGFVLGLQAIGSDLPKWEQSMPRPALLGALSPDGKSLVTVARGRSSGWEICARRVSHGGVFGPVFQVDELPRNIGFTSKTKFYVDCGVKDSDDGDDGDDDDKEEKVEMEVAEVEVPRDFVPGFITFETRFLIKARHPGRPTRTIFPLDFLEPDSSLRLQGFPIRRILPAPPFELDKNLEWIVDAKSRRVCWLPPGYVSRIKNGHCFVGSSIVIVGQGGILRRLTFRKPRSDS